MSAQVSPLARAARVDLQVEQIASAGRWESGKATGGYRVLVVREGSEEVRRRAVLQWIQESAARGPDSLRYSLELTEQAGAYALSHPEIIRRGARWILRLKAASQPLASYDRSVEFELGPPGKVSLVRPP